MSLPDRNNPYSFNEYLEWRGKVDYYADDPFFQKVLKYFSGKDFPLVDKEIRETSPKASFRWRRFIETTSRPEERPYMIHYDGKRNRIDRICRPYETHIMEKEIFREAFFSKKTNLWTRLAKFFIINQNGEFGVSCPMVCTEGLVESIRQLGADYPEVEKIFQHCSEGLDGDFGIGSQFISEIQGGSDVPANLLEAEQGADGQWRLYGNKFFCSATHADYSMVTAKPKGSEDIALFCMPMWLPGNKEKEIRNSYTIDQIKFKTGTVELPTAEITFNGSIAYPVGPLNRGLANMVGIILTYSRLNVGLSCASWMNHAVREAVQYTKFRQAFNYPIANFALVAGEVQEMEHTVKRSIAGAFRMYRDFLQMEGGLKGGLVSEGSEEQKRLRFMIREFIMLQKVIVSLDCAETIHLAMSLLGGYGVMEDFSHIPRLYRDALVNELWEGPKNVLLTQVHRDLQRASKWYKPETFVADLLKGAPGETVARLSKECGELIAYPHFAKTDAATIDAARRWKKLCLEITHIYQDVALNEIGGE
jgi:alkylation response protein AidB-like acyl-CoA dehydrogenase